MEGVRPDMDTGAKPEEPGVCGDTERPWVRAEVHANGCDAPTLDTTPRGTVGCGAELWPTETTWLLGCCGGRDQTDSRNDCGYNLTKSDTDATPW